MSCTYPGSWQAAQAEERKEGKTKEASLLMLTPKTRFYIGDEEVALTIGPGN